MKRMSVVLMIALALAATPAAVAQQEQGIVPATTVQGQQPPPGRSTTTPQGQQQPAQTQGLSPRGALGRDNPLPVNVKLDLTITDQTGTGQPVRKTISMLIADWGDGKVRSGGMITDVNNTPRYNVGLNADAEVRLVTEDKIRARITIEFTSSQWSTVRVETPDMPRQPLPPSSLNETVTVLLTSGKPTIITQSADPASDRKVTVEATATVIR